MEMYHIILIDSQTKEEVLGLQVPVDPKRFVINHVSELVEKEHPGLMWKFAE
jgi:hypothetical protein